MREDPSGSEEPVTFRGIVDRGAVLQKTAQ
jgi:hypothetical protein